MKKKILITKSITTFLLTSIISFSTYCQPNNFEAIITKRIYIEDIPSASGIEILNNSMYIIPDNSPYLFVLDKSFNLTKKIEIFSTHDLTDGVIPKNIKPDFEAIASVKWGKDKDLLIFGSGSSSTREKMLKVDFDKKKVNLKHYKLNVFYEDLRDEAGINANEFNLEGAAVWKNNLILLNRGSNHMFLIDIKDFKKNIGDDKKIKNINAYHYNLPSVQGNIAGFSGCCLLPNEDILVFTASIENTPDWINDGEILGSYIGLIDLNELENNAPICVPVTGNGKKVLDKIESVCVLSKTSNMLKLVVVTDNDNGKSDILLVDLKK